MVYNITILHATINIPNIFLEKKMKEFTRFYINRISQDESYVVNTFECNSIDESLNSLENTDYVIIMSSGNRLYRTHQFMGTVIQPFIDNPELGMMGHILDRKDEWYELHPQFVVFDYKKWVEIGRPSYGSDGEQDEVINVNRSDSNIHDDYTPLWVKSGEGVTRYESLKRGWNFINTFISSTYDISPFPNSIRSIKTYCYPEYNSDKFYNLIDTMSQDDTIDHNKKILINSLINRGPKTWLFNTEEIQIIKNPSSEPYDVVALTCSGFKFLDLLHSDLITNKTKLVFYDFSTSSVSWFKYLMTSKYLTIVDNVMTKPNDVYLIGKRTEPLMDVYGSPTQDFLDMCDEVYDYYGGVENFMNLLIRFRELDITIIHTDIINDPLNCCHNLKGENNLINVSNIFSTDFFNLYYSEDKRDKIYGNFVKTLNEKTTVVGHLVNTRYDEIIYNDV